MNMNDCHDCHDAVLLVQVAQGSTVSFELLYEKYWERTYAEAYKRLRDRDQAKDIVQEIFTSIWLRREDVLIENMPAYLKTAVRNQVFKALAKQKLTHSYFDFLPPAAEQRADTNLLWQEFLRSYENLLRTLPPKKQLIFRLRFQEDLSTTDIARRLKLSRKTVQNQLGRAIQLLRVHFLSVILLQLLLSSAVHQPYCRKQPARAAMPHAFDWFCGMNQQRYSSGIETPCWRLLQQSDV